VAAARPPIEVSCVGSLSWRRSRRYSVADSGGNLRDRTNCLLSKRPKAASHGPASPNRNRTPPRLCVVRRRLRLVQVTGDVSTPSAAGMTGKTIREPLEFAAMSLLGTSLSAHRAETSLARQQADQSCQAERANAGGDPLPRRDHGGAGGGGGRSPPGVLNIWPGPGPQAGLGLCPSATWMYSSRPNEGGRRAIQAVSEGSQRRSRRTWRE